MRKADTTLVQVHLTDQLIGVNMFLQVRSKGLIGVWHHPSVLLPVVIAMTYAEELYMLRS